MKNILNGLQGKTKRIMKMSFDINTINKEIIRKLNQDIEKSIIEKTQLQKTIDQQAELLLFLSQRLIHLYNESPNLDYHHKALDLQSLNSLNSIITKEVYHEL